MADFIDGPENTILLTEVSESNLPWLEPRDIVLATANLLEETTCIDSNVRPPLGISAAGRRRPYVVFADGLTAYAVMPSIRPETMRALATIAGRETITRAELVQNGDLVSGSVLER